MATMKKSKLIRIPPLPQLKNCIVPPTSRLNHCIPNRLHHAQALAEQKQ
jgi:hypothetical protein